ncbi:MAG: thioredoxin domain-containing protein, partial [Cyanobacteria bacterium]|nr:thioredoxin domain-containing protein [Cyanobacteriota bacterium]
MALKKNADTEVKSDEVSEKTPNRLIGESSTYLLQHAYNPVDWFPWGPEALEKARAEEKPILLSIGYAACHWCHVMEHESFEDPETASLMNARFVNIKVDREERTDLDEIYMKAVQMMTGHGGWPMTVFLTPDLAPFFAGTYFPPVDKHGMPSFKRILLGVALAWKDKRGEVVESASEITAHLKDLEKIGRKGSDDDAEGEKSLSRDLIFGAVDQIARTFDPRWGGFGSSPKFPHPFSLSLVMRVLNDSTAGDVRRQETSEIVETSLDKMAYGGIYDHLVGGFARYSVDRQWLIPHFEKMLYDNALLTQTYLDGYLITKRDYWKDVAKGILSFVSKELRTPDGAFYSSLDADSEGEEGKFYVWTPASIEEVLGEKDGKWFCEIYGVTKTGNFEHGTSALHLTDSPENLANKNNITVDELWTRLEPMRAKLLEKRAERIRPGRDEKVLTSWNSLMISAYVYGYRVIQDPEYFDEAITAAEFLL